MLCEDFAPEFNRQYPDFPWSSAQDKIFAMFKSLFEGATKVAPPAGIGHNPQSRATYASDLMLEWQTDPTDKTGKKVMVPKILEVNWGPDCQRACEFYPEYFDNVFSTLFLEEDEGQNVKLL